MNSRVWSVWVLLLAVAPLAAEEPAAPSEAAEATPAAPGVVATVNGEPIYFEDVERRLDSAHSGVAQTTRGAFDLDRMMDRLINDTLLAQEARILEMHNEEPLPGQVAALRLRLAVEQLEKEEIGDRVEITEEEMRRVFEEDYATVTMRIATALEQEEAEGLLARLREGANFESLAREESADRFATTGGLMENKARIDLPPELALSAWKMRPGELTGPIRTSLGWSVIRVESFGEADPDRFEGLKRKILNELQYRKAENLHAALSKRLRDKIEVSVDRPVLNAIACEQLPDARLVPRLEDPESVVARVGERTILAGELADALKSRWKGVRNEEAALATRSIVLERLVRAELLRAEATRRKYDDTPRARRAAAAYEKQLLVRRYLKEVVASQVKIADEEARAYYESRLDRYRKPPRIHLGQITVGSAEEAARIADLLRQGSDLAWLAAQHSTDRFKDSGGDRGWIVPTRGVDVFQDELFEAEPGAVIGPMHVGESYVLFRVDAREEQGHFSLEEVDGEVRSALFAEAFEVLLDDHLKKLRERAEITIHDEVLASLQITADPIEEEPKAPPAPHGLPGN